MSRVAVFALLGLGALAGCVPGPGDPYGYGYGYGYAPAPAPVYDGGYYAAPGPAVIVGGADYGYRDRERERYREQRYREQSYRYQRPRENRGPEAPRIVGNTIQNPRGTVPAQGFGPRPQPQPNPNPSTLPGAIPPGRNTMPIGGGP